MALRGRLFGGGLLAAALLGFTAPDAVLAAPGPADAIEEQASASGMGVDSLMNRLFHLVKRSYADIATLDSQLLNAPNQAAHEARAGELAAKIAAFEERSRRIASKLPDVSESTPSLDREMATYGRDLKEMDSRVREITARHDLDARVADLRLEWRAEREAPAGEAGSRETAGRSDRTEESSWETNRYGASPARRDRRKPRLVAEAGAPALPEDSEGREGVTELVRKIRGRSAKDPAAGSVTGEAVAIPDRVVPVTLEVKDGADRPVPRRRVEFIIETPAGAPVTASLLDGASGVQTSTLLEVTDEAGIARVEMRIAGEDGKMKIERTVSTYPDRTVCRMRVQPL